MEDDKGYILFGFLEHPSLKLGNYGRFPSSDSVWAHKTDAFMELKPILFCKLLKKIHMSLKS